MVQWPFRFSANPILGIDVGTAAIRIVELSKQGGEPKLENYAEISSEFLYDKPFRELGKNSLSLSTEYIAEAIGPLLEEAEIQTRRANFALPDFSSFFTTLNLPPMSKEELPEAVRFEARQHVPLPVSEMALDWVPAQRLDQLQQQQDQQGVTVLLVAVPQRVIEQYKEIAEAVQLQLESLEAEVFSLARALTADDSESTFACIDIGARSTTCSIVENGAVTMSHSFSASGDNLTASLKEKLEVEAGTAEHLKRRYGVQEQGKAIGEVLRPELDSIIMEADKLFQHFHQRQGKVVQRVVLAGGGAHLPGVVQYFSEEMRKEVSIANPFQHVAYPRVLQSVLEESGPQLSVALGVAEGGLQ